MVDLSQRRAEFQTFRDANAIQSAVRRIRRDRVRGLPDASLGRQACGPIRTVVYITPAIACGHGVGVPLDNYGATVGYTRELSFRKVSFTHDAPLDRGDILITFDLFKRDPISLLIEILWQRTHCASWYTTAGRLLAVVDTAAISCRGAGH